MTTRRKRWKLPVWQFPLKEVLARKRLSQGAFSRMTGLPRVQITAMCNRPANPTWRLLLQMATRTGWSLDEFLPKGNDTPPPAGRSGKEEAA
jgi:hypothetical protein